MVETDFISGKCLTFFRHQILPIDNRRTNELNNVFFRLCMGDVPMQPFAKLRELAGQHGVVFDDVALRVACIKILGKKRSTIVNKGI